MVSKKKSSEDARPKYVVGVGASAGGLTALEDLFENVPFDMDMAYVVIQHLSPDFKSFMDEILARHTQLKVSRAENEMELQRNTIYLLPPKKKMMVSNNRLLLSDQDSTRYSGQTLPIDLFLKSLAKDFGDKSIAIILSGSGSDGSRGAVEISKAGGFVIAQSEESAKFSGMPSSVIQTGVVGRIAEPTEMGAVLYEYITAAKKPVSKNSHIENEKNKQKSNPLTLIFELLKKKYAINFNFYRPSTIQRRLDRRMSLTGCAHIEDYLEFVKSNETELEHLYHDLLIGVTRFFRDPEAFELLPQLVFPEIFKNDDNEIQQIRVWTPGCATGEEAYSLAILFQEYMEKHQLKANVKIFATDVHRQSITSAGSGQFSEDQLKDISANRLNKYFIKISKQKYQVKKFVRQMIVFAQQDILTDPPFTNIDLLVCRNLLIYLELLVQEKVLSLFHFALKTNGHLFLGPSESLGKLEDEFEAKSKEWRILKKRREILLAPPARPVAQDINRLQAFPPRHPLKKEPISAQRLNATLTWAYESLLSDIVESGVLIDDEGEVLHFFGDSHQFMKPMVGRPNINIVNMVLQDLAQAVSAATHKCLRKKVEVVYKGIRVKFNNGEKIVKLRVVPLRRERMHSFYMFILFEVLRPVKKASETKKVSLSSDTSANSDESSDPRIADLETELQFTKESLQAANEELETSNEELQATNEELVAANEEMQSTNEELQSTNEELQSTNEELQSVNEELHTVNLEHQEKIEQLSQLSSDMENLLNSTNIGTIFLSKDLTIRKFTPAVTDIVHLLPRDVGRPIEHIGNKILNGEKEDFISTLKKVLVSEKAIIQEVELSDDLWMLMRILPYYDENREVQGIVITMTDITEMKLSSLRVQEYANKLEASNQELQDFAYMASHDLKAPLRQMNNYCQILDEKLTKVEDLEARQVFDHLQQGIDRLNSLITNLLEFSRVHTRGVDFQPFNCTEGLEQILNQYKPILTKEKVEVTASLMPTLKVDQSQIMKVFSNLIDNAIKFKADRPLQLNISAYSEKDHWKFEFKDNGLGIPQEMLNEVFVIFRKAHSEVKNSGTGLGLAICKRIINRHGGRIWVESKSGFGSSFYFTIPLNPIGIASSQNVQKLISQ